MLRTDSVDVVKRFKRKSYVCLCQVRRASSPEQQGGFAPESQKVRQGPYCCPDTPQVWLAPDDGSMPVSRCLREADPKVLYVHITELPPGLHTCLSTHVGTRLES